MRVICVMNRKGGVGKTTTVCNLAYWLAFYRGKRVLVVDLDGQGNAVDCLLGGSVECLGAAWAMRHPEEDVCELAMPCSLKKPRQRSLNSDGGGVWVLPGGTGLFDVDEEITDPAALKRLFENNDAAFDFVLMDCPPEFNMAVLNAFEAADILLIPPTPGAGSLKGAACVLEEVAQYDMSKRLLPILWSLQDIDDLREFGKEQGCSTEAVVATYTPKALQADRVGRLLAEYSPMCGASCAYRELARRLDRGR